MIKHLNTFAGFLAVLVLSAGVSPVSAATLSRSVDVNASPAKVWSMIGPYCAIKDWLPPVGTCTEDGKNPPTRTLVTKDGKGKFVETQTARNDKKHTYSYNFQSTPLPVKNYVSTIKVVKNGKKGSTVTWSSSYAPDAGKEKDADEALSGIYAAGLGGIKALAEK